MSGRFGKLSRSNVKKCPSIELNKSKVKPKTNGDRDVKPKTNGARDLKRMAEENAKLRRTSGRIGSKMSSVGNLAAENPVYNKVNEKCECGLCRKCLLRKKRQLEMKKRQHRNKKCKCKKCNKCLSEIRRKEYEKDKKKFDECELKNGRHEPQVVKDLMNDNFELYLLGYDESVGTLADNPIHSGPFYHVCPYCGIRSTFYVVNWIDCDVVFHNDLPPGCTYINERQLDQEITGFYFEKIILEKDEELQELKKNPLGAIYLMENQLNDDDEEEIDEAEHQAGPSNKKRGRRGKRGGKKFKDWLKDHEMNDDAESCATSTMRNIYSENQRKINGFIQHRLKKKENKNVTVRKQIKGMEEEAEE